MTTLAGCTWTASSNAPWITSRRARRQRQWDRHFTSGANTGPARMGTLTIAGQTFTVNQAAGCSYMILPGLASIGAGGGTSSSMVTTIAGCTWTAMSNAPWITVTSVRGQRQRNGRVHYWSQHRSGANGHADDCWPDLHGQSGDGCTYTLSPTSRSFPNPGGTGSVTVTTVAGCTWTAASNAAHITVLPARPAAVQEASPTWWRRTRAGRAPAR